MSKAKKDKVEKDMEPLTKEIKIAEETVDLPKEVAIKLFRKARHIQDGDYGAFGYDRTFEELTVQKAQGSGMLNTGLTEEDEIRLEKKLHLDDGGLSRFNKDFWKKFKIKVPNGEESKGLILHPRSNPMDEIRYKVALVHQEIANSEAEKHFNGFARYVITTEEDESKEKLKNADIKAEAFSHYNNMSIEDMRDYLAVTVKGSEVTESTKPATIKSKVFLDVEETPEAFVKVLKNPNYKMSVFIRKCVKANVIEVVGNKHTVTGDVDPFAYSMEEAAEYLSNPENQGTKIMLQKKLDIIK